MSTESKGKVSKDQMAKILKSRLRSFDLTLKTKVNY